MRIHLPITLILIVVSAPAQADLLDEVTHHYADSEGVKIHYVSVGQGPLVVMIHGFPDYWYTWRHQMDALKGDVRVVAMDTRGYNRSNKPQGIENYAMAKLVDDVAAVIRDAGEDSAVIVGHDWGGAIAWQFAFANPEMTDALVVLNLPHPVGLIREFDKSATDYARVFREGKASDPDVFFGMPMTPQTLSIWMTDEAARPHYLGAFGRSDTTAMLNYYKANYPDPEDPGEAWLNEPPKLTMPVLLFHGLKDQALHSDGLNNSWDWIDADQTLVTTPNAGHFVQQDAAELVSDTMLWWLKSRTK